MAAKLNMTFLLVRESHSQKRLMEKALKAQGRSDEHFERLFQYLDKYSYGTQRLRCRPGNYVLE
jgi:hypothetical protein